MLIFLKKFILNCFPYFLYPLIVFFHLISWIKGKINHRQFLAKIGLLSHLLTKSQAKGEKFTWVHVASLGEFNTALPLLKRYRQKHGDSLILTYFNPDTCQSSEIEKFDIHLPLPFELPWAYHYLLVKFNICRLFIFETEVWPVLFSIIQKKNIPLFGLNAYINAESISAYHKWFWLFRECFLTYHHLFVRKDDDKREFIHLGVQRENITVTGNLKLDVVLTDISNQNSQKSLSQKNKLEVLENYFFSDTLTQKKNSVIIFSSIHRKEIPLLIPLISLNSKKNLRWIIAPRYLDSLPLIKKTLSKHSFKQSANYDLFSSLEEKILPARPNSNVLILDQYGVLKEIYQYSDIAIIGGSFIPFGGQNILEAIAHNNKVFMGPHYHHFEDLVEEFNQYLDVVSIKKLTILVKKWNDLEEVIPSKKQDNGYKHLLVCSGVSNKILQKLENFITD